MTCMYEIINGFKNWLVLKLTVKMTIKNDTLIASYVKLLIISK